MAILLVRSTGPSRAYCTAPQSQRSNVQNDVVLYASKDGFESNDEQSYRTRYAGDSAEARKLRNMRYEQDVSDTSIIVDNDYYYDEEEEYMDNDDDDEMYMEDLRDDDKEAIGNFWSNPKPGFDVLLTDQPTSYSKLETSAEWSEWRPHPRGAPKPKCVLDMRIKWIQISLNTNTMYHCWTIQNDILIMATKNSKEDWRFLWLALLVWFQPRWEYCPWG